MTTKNLAGKPAAVVLDSTGVELPRKSQEVQKIYREYRVQRNELDDTTRKQSAKLGGWKIPQDT